MPGTSFNDVALPTISREFLKNVFVKRGLFSGDKAVVFLACVFKPLKKKRIVLKGGNKTKRK